MPIFRILKDGMRQNTKNRLIIERDVIEPTMKREATTITDCSTKLTIHNQE